MDTDQALRLVDILVWPAVVLTMALVFRAQLQALIGRVITVTLPGVILNMSETHTLEADAAAARQVDDPAARQAASRLEKAAEEASGAQAEWQRVRESNPGAAALQIAERAKSLLGENPPWFSSTRVRISTRRLYFDGMERGVAVDEAGDLALLILRTPPLGRELSDTYQDWVRAAELLKAEHIPVSVPPFPEHAFDVAGTARSQHISWTES